MPAAFQFKLPRVNGAHNPLWHLKHSEQHKKKNNKNKKEVEGEKD